MSANSIEVETVSELPNFAAVVSSKDDSGQATDADAAEQAQLPQEKADD